MSLWSQTVAYLRLIDSCITQLKAQGPSRTCNESKEEEEEGVRCVHTALGQEAGCYLGALAFEQLTRLLGGGRLPATYIGNRV